MHAEFAGLRSLSDSRERHAAKHFCIGRSRQASALMSGRFTGARVIILIGRRRKIDEPALGSLPTGEASEGLFRARWLPPCFPENKRSRGSLARDRKATDFAAKFGAGEGIRTLDPNLGKVVLYP